VTRNVLIIFYGENEMNHDVPVFKFAVRKDLEDCANTFLPTRAEPLASGWDVAAAQKNRKPIVIRSGEYIKIPLGIRSFAPEGWWYELKPRSSSFAKKHLHALYGTIDNTYENELIFAAQYLPDVNSLGPDLIIKFGDKVGQIIPFKLREMQVELISNEEFEELCNGRKSVRGNGGFGSTDFKKIIQDHAL
jgi:dUTPase